MAGINTKPGIHCCFGCFNIRGNGFYTVSRIVAGVCFGVKFNTVGAGWGGRRVAVAVGLGARVAPDVGQAKAVATGVTACAAATLGGVAVGAAVAAAANDGCLAPAVKDGQ